MKASSVFRVKRSKSHHDQEPSGWRRTEHDALHPVLISSLIFNATCDSIKNRVIF